MHPGMLDWQLLMTGREIIVQNERILLLLDSFLQVRIVYTVRMCPMTIFSLTIRRIMRAIVRAPASVYPQDKIFQQVHFLVTTGWNSMKLHTSVSCFLSHSEPTYMYQVS